MDDSASATDLKSQATAISDGIAAMHREHYGRGADRTRTLIHQDVVMTRLEGCFTTVEKRMVAEGAFLQVRETRTMFQDWMRPRFTEIVEDATGRRVAAFFSQVRATPTWRSRSFCSRGWDRARMATSRRVDHVGRPR